MSLVTTTETNIDNSTAAAAAAPSTSIFGNPLDYYYSHDDSGDNTAVIVPTTTDDSTSGSSNTTGGSGGGGLGLTLHQSIILVTLANLSCILSLFGSICVIRLARKYSQDLNSNNAGSGTRRGRNGNGRRARDGNRNGNGDLYHRLLVLLSSYDIILTSTLLLQPWLIPPENGYPWSFGNVTTCSMMGFFMRFTVAVAITNAYLSLFFMMKLIYQKKDIDLKKYEVPCFIVSLIIPISLGIGGVTTESFNTLATYQICAYGAYPPGCEEDPYVECIRGGNYELQDWIFTSILFVATIIGVTATIKVFIFVRKQLNFLNNHRNKKKTINNATVTKTLTKPTTDGTQSRKTVVTMDIANTNKKTSIGNDNGNASSSSRQQYASNFSETAKHHIQFVRTQSVLYTLAFLNGLLWTVAEGIITDAKDVQGRGGEPGWFTFQLISYIFFPLQGFFNFIIFIRPVYIKRRTNYPTESILSALWGITILGQGSTSLILKNPNLSAQHNNGNNNNNPRQQQQDTNTHGFTTSSGGNSSSLRRNLRGFFRFNTGSRRDSLTTNGGAGGGGAEMGSSSSPTRQSKNNVKLSGNDVSNTNDNQVNDDAYGLEDHQNVDLDPGLSFTLDDDILFSLNVLTTTTTMHQQPHLIKECVMEDDDDDELIEQQQETIHDDTEATDNVPQQQQ